MNCPKCDGTFETKTWGPKISVQRCDTCAGLWCKPEALLELKEEYLSETVLDIGDPSIGRKFDKLGDINCPECGDKMEKLVDERQTHIWYEACHRCGGMYFDAGEVTDLKYETFMDKLRDFVKGKRD